jgi:hypothetical protein
MARRLAARKPARNAVVPTAGCGGGSPPAGAPGETPGKLAGEDARATGLKSAAP